MIKPYQMAEFVKHRSGIFLWRILVIFGGLVFSIQKISIKDDHAAGIVWLAIVKRQKGNTQKTFFGISLTGLGFHTAVILAIFGRHDRAVGIEDNNAYMLLFGLVEIFLIIIRRDILANAAAIYYINIGGLEVFEIILRPQFQLGTFPLFILFFQTFQYPARIYGR